MVEAIAYLTEAIQRGPVANMLGRPFDCPFDLHPRPITCVAITATPALASPPLFIVDGIANEKWPPIQQEIARQADFTMNEHELAGPKNELRHLLVFNQFWAITEGQNGA